jgi:hypothetical protein
LDAQFQCPARREEKVVSKRKVKVEYESPACCNPCMYGMGGYGMGLGGYYGQAGYYGGGGYGGMSFIRWIYALLILIVIVLQFGRNKQPAAIFSNQCCEDEVKTTTGSGFFNNQLIDNSVLFIIVVFLLILCTGCWTGGSGNYGSAGFGGGYVY